MRSVKIYQNQNLAGLLIEENSQHYIFKYDLNYFNDSRQKAISLTLPKSQIEYSSPYLFPFFTNMLSEGANRKLQSVQLHIDENDDFGLLMATAQYDTVGAISIKLMEDII